MSSMSRLLCSVVATIIVLGAFCNPARAESQIFFGPKTLAIRVLHIHASSHLFAVDSPQDAVLTVTKNTPAKHILSGFILLNTTLVPLGDFFRGDQTVFEKTVELQPRNYMAVTFLGDNDASVTIEIKRRTIAPPQITFSGSPLSIAGGETSTLTWTTRNATTVSIDNGLGTVPLSGSQSVSPEETTTYTLSATGPGGTATAAVAIGVYNRPPVANPQSVGTDEDTPLAITLTGSDHDEDPLTYRIVTQPTHGTLSGTLPNLTYTPNENYSGVDAFSFAVNDGDAESPPATVTIQINPLDDVPVANPLTVATDEDTPLSITLTGSDPDDDPLTFRILTDPAHGALSGTPPNLTYTPSANYHGSDSFTFCVNDGEEDSSLAIVTIQVNPTQDRPVAQPLLVAATEDIPVSITLAGIDADNDVLTFAIATSPSHGTLSGTAPNLIYTPEDNYNGTDAFTFIVNDGTQDSEPATVTIELSPVNDAPVSTDGTATTIIGSAVTTGNVLADATDAEGDTLSVTAFTQGTNGAVAYNGDGTFTYTPRSTFSGADSFTYTISDGHGGTTTATINVTVTEANPPPLVTLTASPAGIQKGGSATLSWTTEGATTVSIDNGIGIVSATGSMSVSPSTTTTYAITATNANGSASARFTVKVLGNPASLPEGSFGKKYQDLIPSDASITQYDPKRFSIITGLVKASDGTPLQGVSVTIHSHPEYGTASTDASGRFSLPMDGGTTFTVAYRKEGLLTAHRQVYVPWNDIAIAETITMLAQNSAFTPIAFDGNPATTMIHRSTPFTDDRGTRSATIVFQGDNKAYLVDKNGNDVQELSTIRTRATEYITPESMPAKLPPTSAYTYCAELQVDGTEDQHIRFDKPVIVYVENFLGFNVGEIVPVGYYDRGRGVWVASDNGKVVRLLDTNNDGNVDAYDDVGDGQPHGEAPGLNNPSVYRPGTTYWRVSITHFTPWDCNWPYGPPADATPPNPDSNPDNDDQDDDPCKDQTGSSVECQSRIFHEDIDIPGTDITLNYSSNRADGYKTALTIPASGATVPVSLKGITVNVQVAGRSFEATLPAQPNQKINLAWDGLDFLGKKLAGSIPIHIQIGFTYPATYYAASSDFDKAFAQAGTIITGVRARDEITSQIQYDTTTVGGGGKDALASGWSISDYNEIDLANPSRVLTGDGSFKINSTSIINTVAGTTIGTAGDGGPATAAELFGPSSVVVDRRGNLYITDSGANLIRKVDTKGIITTVAGNGQSGYSGDGGAAIQARMNGPSAVAVDNAGNIYIVDSYNYRVRKVDTNGVITTVAGNGAWGYSGDGGAATSARINSSGIGVDYVGNLYFADSFHDCVRKVDTNGIITTVAGNGLSGYSGDGGAAIQARMNGPSAVAVDNAGNIYIVDYYNHRIRKVDTNGIITTVAGNGSPGYTGDGGPATGASLGGSSWSPNVSLTVDPTGDLYIADQDNHRIRKVDTNGIITTVAGNGERLFDGDGGPAMNAAIDPSGIAVDSIGNLYIADSGNYRVRKIDTNGIITTVAGNGLSIHIGDGKSATSAEIYQPSGITFDAAGNLYIADGNYRIRKVDTNGIITTVAGNGSPGYTGDGGPAVEASIGTGIEGPISFGLAVDSTHNLYIGDPRNGSVRKVDTNGIITTVAGNGLSGYSGDGGPAMNAGINPEAIAVDSAGNLYVAGDYRVRKVDTNGIITTVAGNGTWGYGGDGGPATGAAIQPTSIAVDSAGNLYIAESNKHLIRKVNTNGVITTVAGNGSDSYGGDGGPAVNAGVPYPNAIALDRTGALLYAYSAGRIRVIDQKGIIRTVAGTGQDGFTGDGSSAMSASLGYVSGMAVSPSGELYIADTSSNRVRKITVPAGFRDIAASGYFYADENGQGYAFDSTGKHLSTIDLDTDITLKTYGYNSSGQLISITDAFDETTTIDRDANGVPISITSPDGIITYLTVDSNGNLAGIQYADNSSYTFEYNNEGLLTAKIDPNGNTFTRTFDSTGRITDVTDQEGGHWSYTRTVGTDGSVTITSTTGEGNVTTYLDDYSSTGTHTSTITNPWGDVSTYQESSDGLSGEKTYCGMTTTFAYDLDPQYQYQYLKELKETTTSGKNRITNVNKVYADTNNDGKPDLITTTATVNGKTGASEENILTSRITYTSPMGRTITTTYDPANLLTTGISVPGLLDTTYNYDSKGRLISVVAGARTTTFTYNAQGFLGSITDPGHFTTTYSYDTLGRVTGVSRPDGSTLGFAYDANGNRTVLTNPSDIAHNFTYNSVNNPNSYQTPLSGAYRYFYDTEKNLIKTVLPSNKEITNTYEDSRLVKITTPEKTITVGYACGSNASYLSDGTNSVGYGYDGTLLTSTSLSGILNQSLFFTYDNDFNLQSVNYAGGTASYGYDNDGFLSAVNTFGITRDIRNGLPLTVSNGTMSTSNTFSGYGEIESKAVTVTTQPVSSWSVTRDDSGRVVSKTETINGVTTIFGYTYDSMGRLTTVTKNGTTVETYGYGPKGTRISETNTLTGISRSLTYSDEDHLLTAGGMTYHYDVDGHLTSKQQGTATTGYAYSTRGELLSVTLPNGNVIEYVYDPIGRRIATKVNGAVTEKYLWLGQTKLLAVYDGADNLIMRFDYADDRVPVSMSYEGATYYLVYDQIGSLKTVTDSSGTVVKHIDYDSFGNVLSDSNPDFFIPIGFAGGLLDPDTKLLHFGARDYDPAVGRWTTKDPIGFAGGDTDLYGYVLNDPVNGVDPWGLWVGSLGKSLVKWSVKYLMNQAEGDPGGKGMEGGAKLEEQGLYEELVKLYHHCLEQCKARKSCPSSDDCGCLKALQTATAQRARPSSWGPSANPNPWPKF